MKKFTRYCTDTDGSETDGSDSGESDTGRSETDGGDGVESEKTPVKFGDQFMVFQHNIPL